MKNIYLLLFVFVLFSKSVWGLSLTVRAGRPAKDNHLYYAYKANNASSVFGNAHFFFSPGRIAAYCLKTNELSTADGVSGSKPSFKSSTSGFVIDSVFNDLVIAGEIRAFTGSIIPDGWLACEGQLLNINDYLELFNAIGVTYGGNGQTTFALPDLRDRVATGVSGTTPLGMYGGENNKILSLNNLPLHNHIASLSVSLDNGQQYNPIPDGYLGAVALSGPGTKQNLYTSTATSGTATLNNNSVTVLPTGDSQAFDNRSAYVSVSYIIATRSLNSLSIRDTTAIHKSGNEIATGNKTFQRITTDSLLFKQSSLLAPGYLNFGIKKKVSGPGVEGTEFRWMTPYVGLGAAAQSLNLEYQSNDDTSSNKVYRTLLSLIGATVTSENYAQLYGSLNAVDKTNSTNGSRLGGIVNASRAFTIGLSGALSRPTSQSNTSGYTLFTDSLTKNLILLSGGSSHQYELALDKNGITANRTVTFPDKSGTLALMSDFSLKQDVLISGTSIKTINGNSLLGGGDLNLTPSFGFSAGTVTEGNDSRVLNGQTAFTWGNHSTAGYAANAGVVHNTGNEVIAGTKTFSDKIGIGVSNTGNYQLAVKGTIRTQAIKVDPTNWADYVFAKSYKLPLLSDVEKFINKNQHLPEIPSEAEVKKNGIELGEMNALLLKKIEELTIYMIEKDKEVKELKTRLDILEKKK